MPIIVKQEIVSLISLPKNPRNVRGNPEVVERNQCV
jgi:hypothetical protein